MSEHAEHMVELVAETDAGETCLVGGYSPTSGRYHFPIAEVCPYSGADDVERRFLSPEGTLWAWTAVTAPPPGYAGPVPYGFGVVELPEGLRIVTRLTEADPSALHEGQHMRLVPQELGRPPATDNGPTDTSLSVYAFEPVATS